MYIIIKINLIFIEEELENVNFIRTNKPYIKTQKASNGQLCNASKGLKYIKFSKKKKISYNKYTYY